MRLTLPVAIPNEEKILAENFIFTLLCGALKGGAFIKPFEAPQRSVKIKINVTKNTFTWIIF